MKISERIQAKEQRLVAIKDELTELKALLEDDEYEFSDEEQNRIDVLTDEEEAVVKSIDSLKKMEAGLAAKAQPAASFARRGVAPGAPAKQEKAGSLFAKHVTAQLFAKEYQKPISQVVEELYGNNEEVKATFGMLHEKTATNAADTQTTGWAAELVAQEVDGFMRELQPISVFAALRARGRGLNFNGMSSIKIPSRANYAGPGSGLSGAFVGEGGVIPVKQAATQSQTLNPYKLAVISAWTNELSARSIVGVEALVREIILEDTARTLDAYLTDSVAAVANVRPAGLLNNVAGQASAGGSAANIITDLKYLFQAMQSARVGANPVLVMNSMRLLGLSTITTAAGGFMFRDEVSAGRLLGVPVVSAPHIFPTGDVMILDVGSFVAANDAPRFMVSEQATLTMASADTTPPTQAEGAGGAVGTAEQVPPRQGIHVNEDLTQAFAAGARAQSLFQTYTTAIRMVLPTAWGMVRSGAVGRITGAAW